MSAPSGVRPDRPSSASVDLPPELNPRGRGPAPGRPRQGRRPPTRISRILRRLLVAGAAFAAGAVLLVSASGYALLTWSSRSIDRVDAFAGLTDRPPASAAGSQTFLLVGSDGRTGMSDSDMRRLHVGTRATAAGRRADTMLMVHVSARHGTVDVVSLPRDSYVTIPAHVSADGDRVPERRNKLNAAYAFGGPRLTVATIERSTGVRIDHYLEVDFLGFVRLVDAVGGVDVCSPTRLRDRKAGLRLPAGVTHVDGETGLAYVRARHLDARADLGRVERQQRFLAAMVDRATSRDVLLDPRALVRFLDAALSAVRADPGLTEDELVRLGTRLRHVSGSDIRFRTVPVANPSYRSARAGAVALWDDSAARAVFTAMREDSARPSRSAPAVKATVPPEQVRVQVYNGAGTVGLGATATADLAARGFETAGPAQNWRRSGLTRTLVRFDTRYTESIKTVAAALPGARLQAVAGLGRTMQVVVGSSYDGARRVHVTAPAQGVTGVRTASDHVCS
jgi:LCP family protein required for cell wall assembly